MENSYSEMLDSIAALSARLDQLQADIDFGRVYYAQVLEVQYELDVAQEEVDKNRSFVKKMHNHFNKRPK